MYYHSAELLASADMHISFPFHLNTHSTSFLPWHTLLGHVVAWTHRHDPALCQIPSWSDKTTIYQACRQCLGLRDFKGGVVGAARISRRGKRCEPSWSGQLRGCLDGGRLWASLRPSGRELGGEGLGSWASWPGDTGTENATGLRGPDPSHPGYQPVRPPAWWPHLGPEAGEGQGLGWNASATCTRKTNAGEKLNPERAQEHTQTSNCILNTIWI